jgi:aspartate racemase
MGTIGIVGGIGPESTVEYYRQIISLYRAQRGDGASPSILINSIDVKRLLDLIGANELQKATQYLVEEVEKLVRAGADVGLLAANTPHVVFDGVQSGSPIPLISIVEETCDEAARMGLRRVGLFGTKFTMRGRFYEKVFDRRAITIVTPDADAQGYVHEKYLTELLNGVVLDETREGLLKIVSELKTEQGIEGLILGGTELSLILKDGDDEDIPFLDTTRIHARSAVRELLRRE